MPPLATRHKVNNLKFSINKKLKVTENPLNVYTRGGDDGVCRWKRKEKTFLLSAFFNIRLRVFNFVYISLFFPHYFRYILKSTLFISHMEISFFFIQFHTSDSIYKFVILLYAILDEKMGESFLRVKGVNREQTYINMLRCQFNIITT